jgi:hypothetical protein
MSIDKSLVRFDAEAFGGTYRNIQSIEQQITTYHAQKNTISRLANAFFFLSAALAVKLVGNKVAGTDLKTAVTSSSSVILGLFALATLGGTLWCLDNGRKKADYIASEIQKLYHFPKQKFYGDATESIADVDTAPEVLESMRSCFDNSVPIDTNYTLIVTNLFTLQGTTADNFKCTPVRILTNQEEINKTIAPWRKYYVELYNAYRHLKPTVIMQVTASQCIQGVPQKMLDDGISQYSCHSPPVLNPKGGSIGHHYKAASSGTESHYTNPIQFHDHLVEKFQYVNDLPTTKLHGQMPTFDEKE